jgi:hypothetical protein
MGREVLLACLPLAALLAASLLVAGLFARAADARLDWRRLRWFHADQGGTVQSLSLVLTLPLFLLVMLFIVKLSQLMIAEVVVHYAAFASARSASVWIPAQLDWEQPNCISTRQPDPDANDQVFPVLRPEDPGYGPGHGGVTYLVDPSGSKYQKVFSAAVLACMPIGPSRFDGPEAPALEEVYASMVPSSSSNAATARRLRSKLAYALKATKVEMRVFHMNIEPPLQAPPPQQSYGILHDPDEFRFNEFGWQDVVTVTVRHDYFLTDGALGRTLRIFLPSIREVDGLYVYPISASATMTVEGEKPAVTYVHQSTGGGLASGGGGSAQAAN